MNTLRTLEIAAWIAGIVLLAIYAGARASSERAREDAIAAFEQPLSREEEISLPEPEKPDVATWSQARIAAWRESLHAQGRPEALLQIPSIGLNVPVFDGTSELNLNRGAARIEGTARVGSPGNTGFAGHRDGYFRALGEVRLGDTLHIKTGSRSLAYRIVSTIIVDPADVHVLAPTAVPTVTLVTCYPFYFVGAAPKRFIVKAELIGERPQLNAAASAN